jgi:hypothetical protein
MHAKKPYLRSRVSLAVASRKPRRKVVAASPGAMLMLFEVPGHLDGMRGGPRHTNGFGS